MCLQAGAKKDAVIEVFFTRADNCEMFLVQIIGDVTDEAFNERLVSTTVTKFGKLDVLVRLKIFSMNNSSFEGE